MWFANERLTKGKANFFDPLKKINLDIGLKKTKKIRKAVSVMKEDRQAFGVILGEGVNLEEAFPYPAKSVPLRLAFPDSTLGQNPKHHFRNYLIDVSKSCKSTPPNKARWIIDTMSVMTAIRVKETYKGWFKTVIKFTLPSSSLKPLLTE